MPNATHDARLGFSRLYRFADWPNPDVPRASAGVYAIWRGDDLIYCGMSGRSIVADAEMPIRKYGLVTRLQSHASGRLSGDQFCVYVANRLVLPSLTQAELAEFGSGRHTLDGYTRRLVHRDLAYQFCTVSSGMQAMALEAECRRGNIFGQVPLLNPLQIATPGISGNIRS